jgi:hypothetical protein
MDGKRHKRDRGERHKINGIGRAHEHDHEYEHGQGHANEYKHEYEHDI